MTNLKTNLKAEYFSLFYLASPEPDGGAGWTGRGYRYDRPGWNRADHHCFMNVLCLISQVRMQLGRVD